MGAIMKYKVAAKLILCYLIGSAIMFVMINSFGIWKMERKLINQQKDILSAELTIIINEYINSYYASAMEGSDKSIMVANLRAVDTFLNARIWVIDSNGTVIADTRSNAEIDIHKIDEDFLGHTFLEDAYYKGIFTEPMLCAIQSIPSPSNYSVKGYVCISTSMKGITEKSVYYLDVFHLCFLLFLVAFLVIMIYIYIITARPVQKMIRVTEEYTKGHFDATMNIHSHDEYRELANTIVYMAEELKNMDDYQKKFVANISHDFRSPLTSIKGYAEAMKDGTITYEMQDKYLDIILFESERLTKLTTNLLVLNNFEQNGILLDIRSFDINKVIKKTAATFEGVCTKKRIVCKLQFSEKELYVDADLSKIQQVLYNLIDNAIKFSNQDSSIRITTEEKGNKVYVAVKDFGIGIPKDSIKKIWERFYKTDISRGKDKRGTGLGLSITKEIIASHKENINVVSTENVGTEFIFTLPKSEL